MKKTLVFTAALAFLLSLVVAGISMASDAGPAEMTLQTAAGKKPAVFPHKAHQDRGQCGDCHHGSADGKQVPYAEGQAIGKCESCHNADMANVKLNDFKKAGHENCKECHKREEKEKGALTKCTVCHPKK